MESYKQEIINTRKGCLGSSDGKLIAQVIQLGYVPKSAYERLAEVKGLIEHKEIPMTDAIRTGNEIEMAIYHHLKAKDDAWESNVRWESQEFSLPNVKLISHPDLVKIDYEKKVLHVVEVKTTKYSYEYTRHHYESQLCIHAWLAKEIKEQLQSQYGGKWKVNLALCVYSTEGLDLSQGIGFDPSRMTIKPVRFSKGQIFDIREGMRIINDFLETFNEYYEEDMVNADYLPVSVKTQFDNVAMALAEIKERETKVDEFKQRLYTFMLEKGIKSIKNDVFIMTRVDESEQVSFDYKKYLDDYAQKHPRKVKALVKDFSKTIKRKGHVTIKIKSNKDV